MPPSTPQAAAAAPAPVEASFSSLPEPLALEIFRLVGGPKTRHRRLPMVCRRWSELCYSSDLLRELAAHVRGHLWDQGPTVDQRLRRFFEWLLSSGAAQHVQRLELRMLACTYSCDNLSEMFGAVDHTYPALLSALRYGLLGLGQAGVLTELGISQDIAPLELPHVALPGLRRLHACLLAQDEFYMNELAVEMRLQDCTGLQALHLSAYHLALDPAVRLPPSLTALALGREVLSDRDLGVPLHQLLAPLMCLRRLRLRGFSLGGVQFDAFGSLEHLAMRDCGPLPASVTRLTALQSLAWENTHQMQRSDAAEAGALSAAAADAVLSHLTDLTFLSLMTLESGAARLPASLSRLGRLHTLSLLAEVI